MFKRHKNSFVYKIKWNSKNAQSFGFNLVLNGVKNEKNTLYSVDFFKCLPSDMLFYYEFKSRIVPNLDDILYTNGYH